MAFLAIRKIQYVGHKYSLSLEGIKDGVNIIEGPNGTGKTTLCELIYFALGGSVAMFNKSSSTHHKEIASDTNNSVLLDIEIDGSNYQLSRAISSNDILVTDAADLQVLPVIRSKNEKHIFSDWLLEKLKIPKIEMSLGNVQFILNFRDLARLIYHDQKLEKLTSIYKSPDQNNFYSDSEMVRKTIFEILIGHKSVEYYASISDLKTAEVARRTAKDVLNEFRAIAASINESNLQTNLDHVTQTRIGFVEQLDKIKAARETLAHKTKPNGRSVMDRVKKQKAEIVELHQEIVTLQDKHSRIFQELLTLNNLLEETMLEVTQLKKVIATHRSLGLFSPDTCPYCLRVVDRQAGLCVCGQPIDEAQYEKFFYDEAEYTDILKRKLRSLLTTQEAVLLTEEELNVAQGQIQAAKDKEGVIRQNILEEMDQMDTGIDVNHLGTLDNQYLHISEQLLALDQTEKLITKLDALQHDLDEAESRHNTALSKNKILEGAARTELHDKVTEFNKLYNKAMKSALQECHSAKIDFENYLPRINNGEYREASSVVTVRLLYYVTLLRLALDHEDVKFPRLLILDTPETAGIDTENLIQAFTQIQTLLGKMKGFQIILTTGKGKYPKEFAPRVIRRLSKKSRLLSPKSG